MIKKFFDIAKYSCDRVGKFLVAHQDVARSVMCVLLMCTFTLVFADGTTGSSDALGEGIGQFSNAVEKMKSFVPIVKDLCYILAVVFGLIGGVMIVIAMNNHEQDVNKKIAMTVGAVVFMLVIAQAIPLIFGVATE